MHLFRKTKLFSAIVSAMAGVALSAQAHSLQQIVQHTVQSDPEILRLAKAYRATNEEVNQARAGYFPKLNFHADLAREHSVNNTTKASGHDGRSLWRRRVGFELRQNLFEGFFTYYEMKRTKAKTDADAYATCARAEQVSLQATNAYINVLRELKQVSVSQDNVREHNRIYSMIKERGRSGVGREADIYQATGRLALAKSTHFATTNDCNNAKVKFYKVTGLDPVALTMPPDPSASVLPKTEQEAIYKALKYHPKMKLAVIDVEEFRAQHNAAHATAFPVLDFVAETHNDLNNRGSIGRNDSYSAGLELNYNLFNGGHDVARQRATAYLTQEAAEIRNRTCREVTENVRLTWNNMLTARKRLSTLKEHRDSSAKTASAYNEQFKLGKRTLFDLLDAQNEKFSSEREYVNGVYDLYLAEYRVLEAMGTINSYLNIDLLEATYAPYGTYYPGANPVEVQRHHDAGLQDRDTPSRFYNSQKIHTEKLAKNCPTCSGHELRRSRSGGDDAANEHNIHVPRYNKFGNRAEAEQFSNSAATVASADQNQYQASENFSTAKAFGHENTVASNKTLITKPEFNAARFSNHNAKPLPIQDKQTAYLENHIEAVQPPGVRNYNRFSRHSAAPAETMTPSANTGSRDSLASFRARQTAVRAEQLASDHTVVTSSQFARPATANTAAKQHARYEAKTSTPATQTAAVTARTTPATKNVVAQSAPASNTEQLVDHPDLQWERAQAQILENQQQAEAAIAAEKKRVAEEKIAAKRIAEAKRLAAERLAKEKQLAAQRLAEQKQLAAKRLAEEQRVAMQQRIEEQKQLAAQIASRNQHEAMASSQAANHQVAQAASHNSKAKKSVVSTVKFNSSLTGWAVQVGSFEDQDEVDELVTSLKNYGLNGFLKEIRTPTSLTYEVFIGPTKHKTQAQKLMATLKKLKINGTLVRADLSA